MSEKWNEFLEKTCGCYADKNGNRPCDNGTICDKCCLYEKEFEKEVLKND